jgi:hypothetical protein
MNLGDLFSNQFLAMKNIKGNANQLKTMLKLCNTHQWELKRVISAREKAGAHLFIGEVKAEFSARKTPPKFARGSFHITIRSDGTVDLPSWDSEECNNERKLLFDKAHVATEPTKKLGSGIR